MYDAVYLSPHLDDAALSCGARIAQEVRAGGRVLVLTLFTADEPEEPPSRLAADLRRWWHLPVGEVMARRRLEDESAMARLGAEWAHSDIGEAPYRLGPRDEPWYESLSSLFSAPAAGDQERLLPLVLERLKSLPEHRRLVVPMGVGGHVDHLVARRAAEEFRADLHYYEEFPYVAWKWRALERARGPRRHWRSEILEVDEELFEIKISAIVEYASQVPAMFHDEARLRKQLRKQVRRTGGERLWSRVVRP